MSFEPKRDVTGEVHPSEDQIARRSYQIWLREGCPEGRARDHWRMARAELESELLRRNPARRDGRRDPYFWDFFG